MRNRLIVTGLLMTLVASMFAGCGKSEELVEVSNEEVSLQESMSYPEWVDQFHEADGFEFAMFETSYACDPIILEKSEWILEDGTREEYNLRFPNTYTKVNLQMHSAGEKDHLYMREYNGYLCFAGTDTVNHENALTVATLKNGIPVEENEYYIYGQDCSQPFEYKALVSGGAYRLDRGYVEPENENIYLSITKDAVNNKMAGWTDLTEYLTFYKNPVDAYENMEKTSELIDEDIKKNAATIEIEAINGFTGVDSLYFEGSEEDIQNSAPNSGQTEALAFYHGTSEGYHTDYVGSYEATETDNPEQYMWLKMSIGEDGTGRYEYGDDHGKVIPVEDEKNNRFRFVSDYTNTPAFLCCMRTENGQIIAMVSNDSCPGDIFDLVVTKK